MTDTSAYRVLSAWEQLLEIPKPHGLLRECYYFFSVFSDRYFNKKKKKEWSVSHCNFRGWWVPKTFHIDLRIVTHARTYLWLIGPDTTWVQFFKRIPTVCAAFRPCNFYHKFRHRFFASGHARFSRLALCAVLHGKSQKSCDLPLASSAATLSPWFIDRPGSIFHEPPIFHNFRVACTLRVQARAWQKYHFYVPALAQLCLKNIKK